MYGYFKDIRKEISSQEINIWNVPRIEKDGSEKVYSCFESPTLPKGGVRVKDFKSWLNKSINNNVCVVDGTDLTTEGALAFLELISKTPANFKTAVDITFSVDGIVRTKRFKDWNIWSTLTDEDCLKKVRKYIMKSSKL